MNDYKWLALGVGFMAVLCWFITAPDRRSARHWWRRRRDGREKPWSKLMLTALPWGLFLAAAGLWVWGLWVPKS